MWRLAFESWLICNSRFYGDFQHVYTQDEQIKVTNQSQSGCWQTKWFNDKTSYNLIWHFTDTQQLILQRYNHDQLTTLKLCWQTSFRLKTEIDLNAQSTVLAVISFHKVSSKHDTNKQNSLFFLIFSFSYVFSFSFLFIHEWLLCIFWLCELYLKLRRLDRYSSVAVLIFYRISCLVYQDNELWHGPYWFGLYWWCNYLQHKW